MALPGSSGDGLLWTYTMTRSPSATARLMLTLRWRILSLRNLINLISAASPSGTFGLCWVDVGPK